MVGVFCFYGSHYKFIAAQSSINKYMSGDLRHFGQGDALIRGSFERREGQLLNMMSGIPLYDNNPRGHALNQTIYVYMDEMLSGCREKRDLIPVGESERLH